MERKITVILGCIIIMSLALCSDGCMTLSEKHLDATRETFAPLTHIIALTNDYYSQHIKWPADKEDLKRFITEKKIDFNIEQFKVLTFSPQADDTLLVMYEVKPYGFLEQPKFRDIIKGKIKISRTSQQKSAQDNRQAVQK